MENSGPFADLLFADSQTIVLLITAAFGLLIGKIVRTVSKFLAYAVGIIALFVLALQYLGIVYVIVNFDFLSEIFQWVLKQASEIGVAEHMFFWLPLVYGMRGRRLLKVG